MEDKTDEYSEVVKIEIVVPDPIHYSGGPFCAFINILPVDSENSNNKSSLNIDFISVNLYGVITFDTRAINLPKTNNTLHFPFLQLERAELSNNQDICLIFATNPLYRNPNSINEISTISRKLEFNLLGSVYFDFPLLNPKYFPVLTKPTGFDLSNLDTVAENVCIQLIESYLEEDENNKNLFFSFKCSVEDTGEENKAPAFSNNTIISRDLDLVWTFYDVCINRQEHVGTRHEGVQNSLECMFDQFSNLELEDPEKMERVKKCFENFETIVKLPGEDKPETLNELINSFKKRLEQRLQLNHQGTLEQIKTNTPNFCKLDSGTNQKETMSFTFDGLKLCSCVISGFKSSNLVQDLEISVDSWFSVHFDFLGAYKRCFKVRVRLIRSETCTESGKSEQSIMIDESMSTLGKLKCTITSCIPGLMVPSFNHFVVKVSYELEITFFCFQKDVDVHDVNSVKSSVNNLKTIKWNKPVRIFQNDFLEQDAEEFQDQDQPGHLKYSKQFSKNKLSSFIFSLKNNTLYKVIKL
ncbi:uncharacterized protein TA19640 [Theileria annulata]|uniref:Uncharacterized protein n=1 Tax=Theileria annulata TaxID=5874 RepID=Q4UGJ2_THEAN|nr:uncharacterized protein TA19640 [Theileria annulata]CAI73797.1 hypothetical protein TA19640 [Theileria annulata]|eukprot:XP_954474.1 hypothetical protein TA19640 [Theileria annulata]